MKNYISLSSSPEKSQDLTCQFLPANSLQVWKSLLTNCNESAHVLNIIFEEQLPVVIDLLISLAFIHFADVF